MSTFKFYQKVIENVHSLKPTPKVKNEFKDMYMRLRSRYTLGEIDEEVGLKSQECHKLMRDFEELYQRWFVKKG